MTLQGLLFAVVAIPLTLIILTVLVVVHEFGHFVTARLAGIRVLEFGIGFPPRAKVIGHDHETEYTLNYLPIGGFCLLEGEESNSDDPRAFTNVSLSRQLVVMVAGVTMNLLTAVLLFFIVACVFSPGQAIKFGQVSPGSAAARAGLVGGETIESVNGQRFGFMTSTSLVDAIAADAGKTVTIGYIDLQGNHESVVVTLGTDKSKGILGIAGPLEADGTTGPLVSVVTFTQSDPVTAMETAIDNTRTALGLVFAGLGQLGSSIVNHPTSAPAGIQGPVGITRDVGLVLTDYGPPVVILLAAILSANLALINILPFPPLDGGKVVVLVVKRLFGARGVSAVEAAAYVVGMACLLTFIAWISYFDIVRGGAP
jgi:regulator of sigma E protease